MVRPGKTIGLVCQGHCITAVDGLSVHLSHGSDLKDYVWWAGRPWWWFHKSTMAWSICAGRWSTVQPVLGVAAWSVRQPQRNDVTTVDDGKSVAFKDKTEQLTINWMMFSSLNSTFLVRKPQKSKNTMQSLDNFPFLAASKIELTGLSWFLYTLQSRLVLFWNSESFAHFNVWALDSRWPHDAAIKNSKISFSRLQVLQ